MSKELKIKGALSKDYQQLYVDDEPTGIEINNDGKVRIKNLVVKETTSLINENMRIGSEPLTGGGVTVNIQGGIVDESYVSNELIPAINKATSLGTKLNA